MGQSVPFRDVKILREDVAVLFIVLDSVYSSRMRAKNHGGARRNSGPKTELFGEPMQRIQASLDARTVDLLKVLGDGNVSKGIRVAARVAYDRYQRSF